MAEITKEQKRYCVNYIVFPPVSGMKKSVVRAGNTCGQPKINSQMKNLTVDIGDTARLESSRSRIEEI